MTDHLDVARGYLVHRSDGPGRSLDAAATAHAAIDAAETLRRIEGRMDLVAISSAITIKSQGAPASVEGDEGMCPNCLTPWKCNGPHEPTEAPAHAPTGTAAGDPSPPPAAADTPQEGEVWECSSAPDWRDPIVCVVTEVDEAGNVYVRGPSEEGPYMSSYRTYPKWWRRVSPAPAPMVGREVTAEAQAQGGVEPASDELIRCWTLTLEDHPDAVDKWSSRTVARLIARVRAADAQVALMRPVVEAVDGVLDEHGRYYLTHGPAVRLEKAVRAYREATRGE